MTARKIYESYLANILNSRSGKGITYNKARNLCARLKGENLTRIGNAYAFRFEQDGCYYLYYITSTKEAVIDYERITPTFC